MIFGLPAASGRGPGGLLERLRLSWRPLGASWRRLGAFWNDLEACWERLGGVLEPSWGRLGASWGVMWASWERLGGILCPIFSPKGVKLKHAILDAIFQLIFCGFCLRKSIPES